MLKKKLSKLLSIVSVVAICASMSTSFCFAAASDPTQSVPAHITVASTPIDVTVSEKITMNATAENPALTISDYVLTNNSTLGTIEVSKLKTTAIAGWTLVADSTDFASMESDAQKFSFKHGTHDFATAAEETLSASNTAAPTASVNFSFTGKTGVVTSPLNDVKVADVVATIGYK